MNIYRIIILNDIIMNIYYIMLNCIILCYIVYYIILFVRLNYYFLYRVSYNSFINILYMLQS